VVVKEQPSESPFRHSEVAFTFEVVKLTTHSHLVPRSRMCGAIPRLPNTSSRRFA